jgi:chorismate mutase
MSGGGELVRLRRAIARVDRTLVDLIAERARLASAAAAAKRAAGVPLFDPPQEARVVRRAAERARAAGLPEEDLREVFWVLVGLARRRQAEPAP